MKKLDPEIKPEDLRALKLLKEAWKDVQEGGYKIMTPENFFEELAKWKK